MDDTFFDKLNDIFINGGEGAVCYKKTSKYIPGKRGPSAWETCKVKQEISADVDCFITGVEPAVKDMRPCSHRCSLATVTVCLDKRRLSHI
jgi:hypothetical protein